MRTDYERFLLQSQLKKRAACMYTTDNDLYDNRGIIKQAYTIIWTTEKLRNQILRIRVSHSRELE